MPIGQVIYKLSFCELNDTENYILSKLKETGYNQMGLVDV